MRSWSNASRTASALYLLHRGEGRGRGVPAAAQRRRLGADRPVGDADHPHSRIPIRRAVGAELLQMPGARAQTGFLGQLPRGGLFQVLVDLDEAARQGPGAQERLVAPFDQQHLQRVVPDGEDRDVHGDGEGRVGARIVVVT